MFLCHHIRVINHIPSTLQDHFPQLFWLLLYLIMLCVVRFSSSCCTCFHSLFFSHKHLTLSTVLSASQLFFSSSSIEFSLRRSAHFPQTRRLLFSLRKILCASLAFPSCSPARKVLVAVGTFFEGGKTV